MKVYKDDVFSNRCGAGVSYGFYGRTGGVSTGLYDSLNCAMGSGDDQAKVLQNRALIAADLGVDDSRISTLWQCHSGQCLQLSAHTPHGDDRPKGDGLVTDVPGLAIGVLTADCGPVLFHGSRDNGAPVIGAAHAGWGGAFGGVLDDTVSKMQAAGAVMESMVACVGPCIQQASYEVSEAFSHPFLEKHEESERFFKSGVRAGHLQFDLSGYIAFRLALSGVQTIRIMSVDTYREEENCFSYRRATHRGESVYGRQMSAIVIKKQTYP
jgi:polyphenol oxidase